MHELPSLQNQHPLLLHTYENYAIFSMTWIAFDNKASRKDKEVYQESMTKHGRLSIHARVLQLSIEGELVLIPLLYLILFTMPYPPS